MKCPGCGHDNPPTLKFCGECGARLQAVCPACRHANPPAQKFCGECGAPLAAAPASAPPAPAAVPPAVPAADRFASPQAYTPKHLAEKILGSRSAIEGERKQVTVVFTDVCGFTAMSERLDPEEVHGIMDRAFEVILAAVHRYEGTINQFLGDGVMALFGAPIAHEDHPSRALRAALSIQRDLGPLREEVRRQHHAEFRMRVGINTGLVVVGAIGRDLRMDYTAVGDTTNLAARMLALAQPGQIMMTAQTHRLTDGFFVVEDLGEFTVKGKSEPVRGYAVKAEIRDRTRLDVSRERGLTPLVGREDELRRLREAWAEVLFGRGAVVLVTGEPGVGKSRLLYEFLRTLDGSGHRELEATCVSYGRAAAYHPIAQLLRRDVGVAEGMADDGVRQRIADTLRGRGLADGAEPVALLAHLLGVEAPRELLTRLGAQFKERTHALLRELWLRADEPLVLVVENVHWSDPSSQEVLTQLIDDCADHAVLLLMSARPEPKGWRLPFPAVRVVCIVGLAADDARAMIRRLLGVERVAAPLLELMLAKSEGNPLYLEEILRQLQETGGVVVEEGEARLARDNVAVPESVHDIIAARVDRLEDGLKQTLQGAAVVGRQFATPLLARLFDDPETTLQQRLHGLEDLDFVFLLTHLRYSFKHALTQEVVYSGLLERRRRLYHAAVGHGLEEMYAGRLEEVVELLAHHFGRSVEHDRAVDYAILAGEKAQRRWANAEALAHFEAALKRLDAMDDTEANRRRRIDAVIKQAETKFALGRHAEEIEALEAIRTLVDASADPPRRATWYYWAGFLHSLTGGAAQISIDYCRRSLEIADATGIDDLRPYAECCLSHVYLVAGRLHEGLEAGDWALERFEAAGNPWWACRALWALQPTAVALGEWERALAYCRRALAHATAIDDRRLKIVAYTRLAGTEIQRGDVGRGLEAAEQAAALSPAPFDATMLAAVQALGRVKHGDAASGLSELESAVAWFDKSGLRYTRSLYALWLADARLRHGASEPAQELGESVLGVARDRGYRHVEGIAERILGASLVERDGAAARPHLDAAAAILGEVGARNELAKTWVAQAALCRGAGNTTGARALLAHAVEVFEALGTLDEAERGRALLRDLG